MRFVYALIFWIVVAIIAFFAFAFSGVYPVGADVPHWSVTRHLIGLVRERSIDHSAADIKPPPLDDPALVKLGAEHYAHMCTGCHLAPGMGHSDLRDGMYPRPPNLTRFAPHPAEAFWVIKHGLKMTGMPAWGDTHDDHTIWALVAYLQKQPRMSAVEFHALSEGSGHDHAEAMPAPAASVPAPAPAASAPAAAATAGGMPAAASTAG